ncbi:Growth arrest-specific protein 8 [Orchesella cincta]|uniref:Growth arrest-specific protein 8 n=1 Tax=Orchesella cincta TaxID=48709 RepID=A0A1D2MQM6_ORCCI|nr:Growth arrest-specific protein 8 [Orchesella cincta]
MPPKKDKSKGKGKDKKPAGMSKKEKKLWEKFGRINAEGPDGKESSIVAFRRDELEWAVERLREQVTVSRSERIRYQLERDYLMEMQENYRKKLECLIIEQKALIAKNNRAAQDAEENKIIKGMEGKHFRAEVQIMASRRSVVMKYVIADMLQRTWQYMSMDMDEQDALLEKNAQEYKKRIQETQKKLQDLHKYMEDHDKQLEEFIKNLEQEMENSLNLFFITRRMEHQLTEERWDEFIWKLSNNFENSLKAMKNFYNDASFSNFTMMYTLQDMISSSVERMQQYNRKIKDLQHMMQEAHNQMPTLRITFGRARVRHDRIVRTKAGIKTVNKELQLTQNKTNALRVDYRQNFHRLENINAERGNFRSNGAEMVQNVMDAFNYRFRVQEDCNDMQDEIDKMESEKARLLGHFNNPQAFPQTVGPYKTLFDEKEKHVEDARLSALRIHKQNEDLRNSLEARLLRLGLTKKHATVTPEIPSPFGVGRIPTRIDWGPANLVAKRSFRMPRPIPETEYCDPDLQDVKTAVPVCMTDSIRGFLAWKEQQREQRMLAKSGRNLEEEEEAVEQLY